MKITLLTPALVAMLGLALGGAPVTAPAQMNDTTTPPAPAAPATTAPEAPAASTSPTVSTATAPATTTTPTKTKKAKKNPNYNGTLTAIDTTASTITVSTSKKDPTKLLTLSIASTAKIMKNKQPATLADFAVGDKVGGSYTVDASGTKTAVSLYYHAPKPVKPPTAPATMAAPTPGSQSAPAAANPPAPAPTPATPAGQ